MQHVCGFANMLDILGFLIQKVERYSQNKILIWDITQHIKKWRILRGLWNIGNHLEGIQRPAEPVQDAVGKIIIHVQDVEYLQKKTRNIVYHVQQPYVGGLQILPITLIKIQNIVWISLIWWIQDYEKCWPLVQHVCGFANMLDISWGLIHVFERYSFISYYLIYYWISLVWWV